MHLSSPNSATALVSSCYCTRLILLLHLSSPNPATALVALILVQLCYCPCTRVLLLHSSSLNPATALVQSYYCTRFSHARPVLLLHS
ncbi:hypothetical protein RchiOBHm_Chr3g0479161 [Rosa chinensis]|uniref:Uncharacterized protein n=1 Tax=Rosa chinensis TaxID=74649 RepID=A0A2P6RDD5_ROSCH|nr:hypothetical protein RchiOBHm_Chr3g0479161 [Rosa chinensis]